MFEKLYRQFVFFDEGEYDRDGLMQKVAQEVLDNNKDKFTATTTMIVDVHEHGGWWLAYTLDKEGKATTVGSANDAAVYTGEKAEYRSNIRNAVTEYLPEIRRKAEIAERIYSVGNVILSHQKKGVLHRLVLCCEPPQQCGIWVHSTVVAMVADYRAEYSNGVEGGKLEK